MRGVAGSGDGLLKQILQCMKDHDDGALEFVDEDLQQAVLFDDVDGDQLWTKTDKRQQKMYTTPPGWKDFVFFS